MKHIRKCILLLICLLTASAGLLACSSKEEQKQDVTQTEKQMNTDKNFSAAAKKLQPVKVTDTAFTRLSRTDLQISWSDSLNPYVTEYAVLRKEAAQQMNNYTRKTFIYNNLRVKEELLCFAKIVEVHWMITLHSVAIAAQK